MCPETNLVSDPEHRIFKVGRPWPLHSAQGETKSIFFFIEFCLPSSPPCLVANSEILVNCIELYSIRVVCELQVGVMCVTE